MREIGLAMVPDFAGSDMAVQAEENYSDAVMAVAYRNGVDDDAFREMLRKEYGIYVIGNLGAWAGKSFRVGLISPPQLEARNLSGTLDAKFRKPPGDLLVDRRRGERLDRRRPKPKRRSRRAAEWSSLIGRSCMMSERLQDRSAAARRAEAMMAVGKVPFGTSTVPPEHTWNHASAIDVFRRLAECFVLALVAIASSTGTAIADRGGLPNLRGQEIYVYTFGGTQLEVTMDVVIRPFENGEEPRSSLTTVAAPSSLRRCRQISFLVMSCLAKIGRGF